MFTLFVGWDRASWRVLHPMIDDGLLPALARLVESGCSGTLQALPPLETPSLWADILTARTPDVHRVLRYGDTPWVPTFPELLPDASVCGWPCGDIRGVAVSDIFALPPATPHGPWPIPAGAEPALLDFRIEAADFTGDDILPLLPDLNERWALPVAAALAETSTLHACATWILEGRRGTFLAARYPMAGRLIASGVPDDVVRRAFQLQDAMLARLLELAGPDTQTIFCSEGAAEASGQGAICWSGPAFRSDALVFGLRSSDVAPTVLASLDIPIPQEWPGRVAMEAFRQPPPVVERAAAAVVTSTAELLRALAAEGYEDGSQHAMHLGCTYLAQGRAAEAEAEFKKLPDQPLAVLYLAAAKLMQHDAAAAQQHIDTLPAGHEWKPYERVVRAAILLDTARWGEALALIEAAGPIEDQPIPARLLMADLYFRAGRMDDARRCYAAGGSHLGVARVAFASRQWEEAVHAALDAIASDAAQPAAHDLLGRALQRLGRTEDARRAFHAAACFAGRRT